MQTTVIILSLIVVIFASIYYVARAKMKSIPMVDDSDKILTLSDKNFQHQTKNKIVLVDFLGKLVCPLPHDGTGTK